MNDRKLNDAVTVNSAGEIKYLGNGNDDDVKIRKGKGQLQY
jgi:hypothetical protein